MTARYNGILNGIFLVALFVFTACTKDYTDKPAPVELTREHACAVCGMITVDFPGGKAQIHHRNGAIDAFCSTVHMFSFYLSPDSSRNITAIYVNDMGKADWNHPKGNWIDARAAFYVTGGDVMGPHGEAFVPFVNRNDAMSYGAQHGGKIITFDDVTMDMLRPHGSL